MCYPNTASSGAPTKIAKRLKEQMEVPGVSLDTLPSTPRQMGLKTSLNLPNFSGGVAVDISKQMRTM